MNTYKYVKLEEGLDFVMSGSEEYPDKLRQTLIAKNCDSIYIINEFEKVGEQGKFILLNLFEDVIPKNAIFIVGNSSHKWAWVDQKGYDFINIMREAGEVLNLYADIEEEEDETYFGEAIGEEEAGKFICIPNNMARTMGIPISPEEFWEDEGVV